MDYRTPNIYDPSTLTEPYAYARANPVMFWDPDGLSWLGDFAKHSFEYFASGQATENLTAFVDGAVDGTVGAVLHAVTETGNMVHDLANASYSVHKYALTGELHEFEMRSAIGKSAEQGNDGVAGAARNLGAMAKGAVTAPLEMGKDLASGDPRRMGQGLAKLEIALAMAGARHGFSSPVSQVGRGVVQDIKSTATTILEKSKSLVSKKSAQPPSSITLPPSFPNRTKGRRGNTSTRTHIDQVRDEFLDANPDYRHVAGGTDRVTGELLPEEYLPPLPGNTRGASYPDLTFEAPNGSRIRINTTDTRMDGSMTAREQDNFNRIFEQTQEPIIAIPKPRK